MPTLAVCEFPPILSLASINLPVRCSALLCCFVLLSGCWGELKERTYDAPKIESEFVKGREPQLRRTPPMAGPMMGGGNIPMREKRILGAIIPDGGSVFFVKATDRIAKLDSAEASFRNVVEQFSFDRTTGGLQFELPAGWTMKSLDNSGAGIGLAEMIAEINFDSPDGRIRFTVSKYDNLPRDPSMFDEYLLGQINRWRGQVEQPPMTVSDLKSLTTIARKGATLPAYLFDANGAGSSNADASAVAVPPPSETNVKPNVESVPQRPAFKLVYDKPADWELQPAKPFREATFKVTRDGKVGEVSITTARDMPVQNAAMWIGQVLPSSEPAQLESLANKTVEQSETIQASGKTAKLYTVRASDQRDAKALLVASIPLGDASAQDGGMSVFVKLNCDLRMMEEEKTTFLNFVQSLRWE